MTKRASYKQQTIYCMEIMKVFLNNSTLKLCIDFLYSSGYQDLGLSSIDPLKIDDMQVNENIGPVEIEATMKNLKVFGLSTGSFYKFRGFENNKLEIGLKTPSGVTRGLYTVDGSVLFIPVAGKGAGNCTFCGFISISDNNILMI